MMGQEKEIDALIKLLNDDDEQILENVRLKIMSYGEQIIVPLELAWSNTLNPDLQHKIEEIIHQIQFNDVKTALLLWQQSGAEDLLEGAIVINKYQYPELDVQHLRNLIGEIRRSVWMEMYYTMSPYEKTRLLNHIFFTKYNFTANIRQHNAPENSYISQVLESKKGNQISLSILYSTVAQQLHIPIFGINLPQHFIMGYTDDNQPDEVLFYINPFNKGQIFGKNDIDQFLKQLRLERLPQFYKPCSNTDIIKRMLRNLISSYESFGNAEKVEEIKTLLHILGENFSN